MNRIFALLTLVLASTSSFAGEASGLRGCEKAVHNPKATVAERIHICAVEYIGRYKVYMQTGDEDVNADAMYAAMQISQILIGDENTKGLAETDPALYEKALGAIRAFGASEPDAAYDLHLLAQAAWDSKYMYAAIYEVGKKERYRTVPVNLGLELFGKGHIAYQALVDPFANVSYLRSFTTLATWWSAGAAAGEGLADWKADGNLPKAPASFLSLSRPWEGDAMAAESRAFAQRKSISALTGGWTAATVTRAGASRLARIRGPFAVKAVAWLGLIAVSIYADKKSEEATSAILSKSHERKLIHKLKTSLRSLADAVNAGKKRRELIAGAREVTEVAYRLAAHWEAQRDLSGEALEVNARIEEFRTLEAGRRALQNSVVKVATANAQDLVARSDRERAAMADRVARGDLENTIEGLFLQLSAYFSQTGNSLLSAYGDQVLFSRASRAVLVKNVIKQLRDGDMEPDEAKDQLKGKKL